MGRGTIGKIAALVLAVLTAAVIFAALIGAPAARGDSLTFAHSASSSAHDVSDIGVRYDREGDALSAVVDVGSATDNGDTRDRFRFAATYRHDIPLSLFLGVSAEHSTAQRKEFGIGKYKVGASSANAVVGRRWGAEGDRLRLRLEAGLGVLEAHGGPFAITDGCFGGDCAGWFDGAETVPDGGQDVVDVYADMPERYRLHAGRGLAVAPIPGELAASYRFAARADYAVWEGVDAYMSATRDAHLSGADEVSRLEWGATARIGGRLSASARLVYEAGTVGGLDLHAPGTGWRREIGISYEL